MSADRAEAIRPSGNALAREGAHGLRTLIKTITDRQCTEIADAFERLASLAQAPSDEGRGEGEAS